MITYLLTYLLTYVFFRGGNENHGHMHILHTTNDTNTTAIMEL